MDEDKALVKRAKNGDREAFGMMVSKYMPMVYNIVYSVTGKTGETDDIVQDVFVKAFTALSGFSFRSSFKTWLYRVTVNKCYDSMRKNKLRKTLPLEDIRATMENRGLGEAGELLAKMPAAEKIIITLRDIEGFSYDEISKILKCSLASVKVRLLRARRELARRYRENENRMQAN